MSVLERFVKNENALNDYIVQLLTYTHGKRLHTIDPKLIEMGVTHYNKNKSNPDRRIQLFTEYTKTYWSDIEGKDKTFLSTLLKNTLAEISAALDGNEFLHSLRDRSFPQLMNLADTLFISDPPIVDDESIKTLWILLNNMRKLCVKYSEEQ